jgi:hypothetical protein
LTQNKKRYLECWKARKGIFIPNSSRKHTHLVYKTNRAIARLWPLRWYYSRAPSVGELRSLCGKATEWPTALSRRDYRGRIEENWEWDLANVTCGHCRKILVKIMELNGEAHKLVIWEV